MREHEGTFASVDCRTPSSQQENIFEVLEKVAPRLMDSQDQSPSFLC